jgi:hypothetical protein
MGEVYAAFDERLERRVARKLLPERRTLDAVARGRMLREARAASALNHPGTVTIYEVGQAAGRTFIAMELAEGETLAQLSKRRGPLPPAEAVALVRQIGDALAVMIEAAEAALAPPELASPSSGARPAARASSPEAARPSADAAPPRSPRGPRPSPRRRGPGRRPRSRARRSRPPASPRRRGGPAALARPPSSPSAPRSP